MSDPAPPPTGRSGGCARGCLVTVGLVAAAAVALAIGVVVWLAVFSSTTGSDRSSGNSLTARPVGPQPPIERSASSRPPPGTEGVEPVPEDRLLVSVVRSPARICSGRGPDLDLEFMPLAGGPRRPVPSPPGGPAVNTGADEVWPRISPDRRRFLFYRTPVGTNSELCRYERQDLWLANADGTGVRSIFSNERKRELAASLGWPAADAVQGHAEWAPDGRHVVMMVGHVPHRGPIPLLAEGQVQLFVLDVDSGELRQVTERVDARGRGLVADPSYTPDGSSILFVGCPDATPSCSDTQILSVPADSVKSRTASLLFDGPGRGANDVYVSPDGRSVAWIEVGLLGVRLYAAPFEPGREVPTDSVYLVDRHGGYANWSASSGQLVYNRLWFDDRFPLFSNRFDEQPSRRLTPTGTTLQFLFFST